MGAFLNIAASLLADAFRFVALLFRSTKSLQAENLFLRRQLALFMERGVRPHQIDAATRVSLLVLAKMFDWRGALIVVQPATMIGWHRAGWRLFWRLKSRPGRPRIPLELRALIRRMATENALWGEERIASELLVKLGIRISPRTVRKYMPKRPDGQPRGDQRWATFLKNHAKAILACDFFVAVTATFRMLYVFVVIEHGTRQLKHVNVTANPTADWTLQQLRDVVGDEGMHRYLIHDRDRIYAKHLDDSIRALGIKVLRSPVASPKANAYASHCTSFERCGRTAGNRRLSESLCPGTWSVECRPAAHRGTRFCRYRDGAAIGRGGPIASPWRCRFPITWPSHRRYTFRLHASGHNAASGHGYAGSVRLNGHGRVCLRRNADRIG